MYIENSVALDLCDRYQFDNICRDMSGGEAMIDVGFSCWIVRSRLNVNNSRSSPARLKDSKNDTELSQGFPGSNVTLERFGNWKKYLKIIFEPNLTEPKGR